jgi:hypothetical protein
MRIAVVFASLCAAAWVLATPKPSSPDFRDIAAQAGLTGRNVYGGLKHKDYILETTGNGVAIFDYDGDGRNDIFIGNGSTLDAAQSGVHPHLQLYHNEGKGRFTDVALKAGLTAEGWAQGVCVGDYDNDGHPDMLVAYLATTSFIGVAAMAPLRMSPRRRICRSPGLDMDPAVPSSITTATDISTCLSQTTSIWI